MTNLDSILKSRDITLPTKVCLVEATVFLVVTYGCESWTIKKAECWRNAFELWCWRRLLRESLDCKEIQPVYPKRNQSWIFFGRTDAEAETPILWPPDGKNWLIWKDPDAGKDWRQKGTTEDEMVGWHHWLNGHEFELSSGSWWWTGKPGVLQSMESESDTTEQLNSYLYAQMTCPRVCWFLSLLKAPLVLASFQLLYFPRPELPFGSSYFIF